MKNRSTLAFMLGLWLVSIHSEAKQDTSLPLAGSSVPFRIPIALTEGTCSNAATDENNPLGATSSLKLGICKFHAAEILRSNQAMGTERRQLWAASIDALNQAQTQGLTGNEHSFAALTEGTAHCHQAQDVLQEVSGAFNPATVTAAQYSLFCSGRRQALAAFSDVNWSMLNISYENSNLSLDGRISDMAECYSTVLGSAYDSVCGLVTELPQQTIDDIVEQETETALYQAFDSAGAPVDKLITHKIERIRAVVEDAWQEMTGCTLSARENSSDPDHAKCKDGPLAGSLEAAAGLVTVQHESLKAAVIRIEPDVNSVVQNYRNAILSGYAVLDEYNRWKNGLYEGNLSNTLTQRSTDLKGVNDDFHQLDITTKRGKVSDATGLAPMLVRMARSAQTRNQAIKSLCQVVFCEFYEWNRMDEDTVPACTESGMADNPLCIDQNYRPKKDGNLTVKVDDRTLTQSLVDLCTQAGFPAELAKIGADEPEQCFAQYQLPE